MGECIFCKIASGEIKTDIIYEDFHTIAFNDINPQAPVHILVIPRQHIETLDDVTDFSLIGSLFKAIDQITEIKGLKKQGYRVVVNCKEHGGQAVPHLHFHILGGRPMNWPPG